MADAAEQITILDEPELADFDFTAEEIREYAAHVGIDVNFEADLMWLAEEGLRASLPEGWVPCEASVSGLFYFHTETGVSQWEHPVDDDIRLAVETERASRVIMPLTLVSVAGDCDVTIQAWNLAGELLASLPVSAPETTPFGELRAQLLEKVRVPEGSAVRLLQGARLLGRDRDSETVAKMFPQAMDAERQAQVAVPPAMPRRAEGFRHAHRILKQSPA